MENYQTLVFQELHYAITTMLQRQYGGEYYSVESKCSSMDHNEHELIASYKVSAP
jgi:hypothetical protein